MDLACGRKSAEIVAVALGTYLFCATLATLVVGNMFGVMPMLRHPLVVAWPIAIAGLLAAAIVTPLVSGGIAKTNTARVLVFASVGTAILVGYYAFVFTHFEGL